jgi:ABC-type Fe3+-hydroxamate transport system substrate-binding protein
MTTAKATGFLLLGMTVFLTGCAENPFDTGTEPRLVEVMGRTWTVEPNPHRTNAFVAWRDNNNLNPFGRPVALRTPQAVTALELATGCKVVPGRIYQNTSAEYFADMACPVAP